MAFLVTLVVILCNITGQSPTLQPKLLIIFSESHIVPTLLGWIWHLLERIQFLHDNLL